MGAYRFLYLLHILTASGYRHFPAQKHCHTHIDEDSQFPIWRLHVSPAIQRKPPVPVTLIASRHRYAKSEISGLFTRR